jgi:predicted flavoprotein YhiN
VALTSGRNTVRGECIVTRTGIEGGAVYALSEDLREAIDNAGRATLQIALRPDLEANDLIAKLSAPKGKQSLSNFLRKAVNLSPVAIGLLHEAAKASGMSLSMMPPADVARLINAVPIELTGTAPIARAISTAGGISFDELDPDYMLRRLPGVFAAGEMLDWQAPTGGYLLQASFATGAAAGRGALKWLERRMAGSE